MVVLIVLNGKEYETKKLSEVEELFFNNYLVRRIVAVYEVAIEDVTADYRKHAMCDLNCVRYRACLATRHHGLTLRNILEWVTDENAVDIFEMLNDDCFIVVGGIGQAAMNVVNENRRRQGMEPLETGVAENV